MPVHQIVEREGTVALRAAFRGIVAQTDLPWRDTDAAQALQVLAWGAEQLSLVGAGGGSWRRLLFPKQAAVSVMLGAVDVHPMQPLEVGYQRVIRAAAEAAGGGEAGRQAAATALDRYFRFVFSSPALVPSLGRDTAASPFDEDLLRACRRSLRVLESRVGRAREAGGDARQLQEISRSTVYAVRLIENLLSRIRMGVERLTYLGLDPSAAAMVPGYARALAGLPRALAQAEGIGGRDGSFPGASSYLSAALQELLAPVEGLATSQSLFFIEPFYLYRMLVRFRLESSSPIDDDERTKASDTLTEILHEPVLGPDEVYPAELNWLGLFMAWVTTDLNAEINRVGGANARFYLKGGRAVAYRLGQAERGTKDWDTQVIINPHLPETDWYACFDTIHNAIVTKIALYRRLFMLLLLNPDHADALCRTVIAALTRPGPDDGPVPEPEDWHEDAPQPYPEPPVGADDEEPPMPGAFAASCKAELLDVSLPRRASAEAFAQWRLLNENPITLIGGGGGEDVPCPGPGFFAIDLLTILREVLAGRSPSIRKAGKRLKRLSQMLRRWDRPIPAEMVLRYDEWFPASMHAIGQMPDRPSKRLGYLMLRQFAAAYDLDLESPPLFPPVEELPTMLSQVFDRLFSTAYSENALPPDSGIPEIQGLPDPDLEGLSNAVRRVALISNIMETHLQHRAEALDLLDQQGEIRLAVDPIFHDEVWEAAEGTELRIGLCGAIGSHLQATVNYPVGQLPVGLDPIVRVDSRLFFAAPEPSTVSGMALARDIVATQLEQSSGDRYACELRRNGLVLTVRDSHASVRFQAPMFDLDIPYAPIVLLLTTAPALDGWPLISSVDSAPVAPPRSLLLEFRQRTGAVDEYATRHRLEVTSQVIEDMLTRYDAPPRPPYPIPHARL